MNHDKQHDPRREMLALMRTATALLHSKGAGAATEKIQQALGAMLPAKAWSGSRPVMGEKVRRDNVLRDINPAPGVAVPDAAGPDAAASDAAASDSIGAVHGMATGVPAGFSAGLPANFVPDLLARLGVTLPDGLPLASGAAASGAAAPGAMRFDLPDMFAADQAGQSDEVDAAAPGQFLAQSFFNHAGSRGYKLYVPTGYHGQALPLVVLLHGCKQHPDDFAAGTGFNLLAEETPCLVLYPAQAQSANVSSCWNWFGAGDQQRGQGEPAIIAGMTQQVMDDYGIDKAQVYVAGLSAGGAMAVIMGRTYPELYGAIGIHSGLPYGAGHDLPSALAAMKHGSAVSSAASTQAQAALPVIVFHGERDATVHPRNADQIVAQSGVRGGSPAVTQGRVEGGRSYTRTEHHDGDGNVIAEQWLVHGAGHAWSGGSRRGSYTDRKGPDASREMMRFFATQHAHNVAKT
jgi:poly(hydroxyalkanoate) depolymerase family esterase